MSPTAFVGDGPDRRPDGQQRTDHRLHIGCLDKTLGNKGSASDGEDLAQKGEDCRFQHGGPLFRGSVAQIP